MADFPSFGGANRAAAPTQRDTVPNIQFGASANNHESLLKTATVGISISNLNVDLVSSTLDRIFAYALASANNDLTTSPILPVASPTIHFEIDISKAESQGTLPPSIPGGIGTLYIRKIIVANIDILIEYLDLNLLNSTLERIKTYMSTAVTTDLNP